MIITLPSCQRGAGGFYMIIKSPLFKKTASLFKKTPGAVMAPGVQGINEN
jgi:hypothetical protein